MSSPVHTHSGGHIVSNAASSSGRGNNSNSNANNPTIHAAVSSESKERQRQEETANIAMQLNRMATDRAEILHGAQDLTTFLEGFEKGYNASVLEEFPSPEQMDSLLQDIEFQREKSVAALMEISKSLDRLGNSSSTDVTVDDELDLEPKEVKRIGEDHNKGVHSLAAKLTVIFSKSKKYYNEVLHSFAADGLDLDSDVKSMETEANVEQALIPMLQQKIVHLKKEIELSRMKSQSTQVQWYAIRKNVACCH
jgi:hypothetical protein